MHRPEITTYKIHSTKICIYSWQYMICLYVCAAAEADKEEHSLELQWHNVWYMNKNWSIGCNPRDHDYNWCLTQTLCLARFHFLGPFANEGFQNIEKSCQVFLENSMLSYSWDQESQIHYRKEPRETEIKILCIKRYRGKN
jgi:hypothetical protein